MSREEYIEYFTHMQEEDQKYMLGGMAWDDIGGWYWTIGNKMIISTSDIDINDRRMKLLEISYKR